MQGDDALDAKHAAPLTHFFIAADLEQRVNRLNAAQHFPHVNAADRVADARLSRISLIAGEKTRRRMGAGDGASKCG